MKYICDRARHLICEPYSVDNLHRMAASLGIKKCWFHKDHYDIPKQRIAEISEKCEIVASRRIIEIIRAAKEGIPMIEVDEEKLDRFILFLSRTDPDKALPSRNLAREILTETLSKKGKKDERAEQPAPESPDTGNTEGS